MAQEDKSRQRGLALPTFSASCSSLGFSRGDNMETSFAAVRDISSVLQTLATSHFRRPTGDIKLWDPFYCQGSVKAFFAENGFARCHNEPVDFYDLIKEGNLPVHDVLVTNPPYTGQHIERALSFCARNGSVPWAMLLPTNVLERLWWQEMTVRLQRGGTAAPPMFLAPTKRRYEFLNRYDGEEAGKTLVVAPLETMWFVGGLEPSVAHALLSVHGVGGFCGESKAQQAECVLATMLDELPRRIRKIHVYAKGRAQRASQKKKNRPAAPSNEAKSKHADSSTKSTALIARPSKRTKGGNST